MQIFLDEETFQALKITKTIQSKLAKPFFITILFFARKVRLKMIFWLCDKSLRRSTAFCFHLPESE